MNTHAKRKAVTDAKFLQEVFPAIACEILEDEGVRKRVEETVEGLSHRLGKPHHTVMALIEDQRYDELRALKTTFYDLKPSSSTAASPNLPSPWPPRHPGVLPITPESLPGEVDMRGRLPETIIVLHKLEQFEMLALPSGEEFYAIGEDKLERFQNIRKTWMQPDRITINGRHINIGQYVNLTFARPDVNPDGTNSKSFCVVPEGYIQGADVLLGSGKPKPRRQENGARSPLPMTLDAIGHEIHPHEPSPPLPVELWQAASSTNDIHSRDSRENSPRHTYSLSTNPYGRKQHSRSMQQQHYHHLQGPPPPNKPASMRSGPPSLHDSPSRPGSAQSNRTARLAPPPIPASDAAGASSSSTSKSDIVKVSFSIKGGPATLMSISLSRSTHAIPSSIERRIRESRNDNAAEFEVEMTAKPLLSDGSINLDSTGRFALEWPYQNEIWPEVVEHLRANRMAEAGKGAEFTLDVG